MGPAYDLENSTYARFWGMPDTQVSYLSTNTLSDDLQVM